MGGGGQGDGTGAGQAKNGGVASTDGAAALHAADARVDTAQGQRFVVAENNDELRAIVVPYPTAVVHKNDWKNVQAMDAATSHQELVSREVADRLKAEAERKTKEDQDTGRGCKRKG